MKSNYTESGLIWYSYGSITGKVFTGEEAKKYFHQIATLRISLFKEFPYLYEGNIEYEKEYLNIYFNSPNSSILLIFDKNKIVGFSSSIPLEEEMDEIKDPFIQNGLDIKNFLYIGELMILESYRGKILLKLLFTKYYEKQAAKKGYPSICFMTVVRNFSHPLKPIKYRPLDPLWKYFGYKPIDKIDVSLSWKQIDTHKEEENKLKIWSKLIIK